jgi:dTDP-4-amino-4,6-dideoxygalactose transaminase
MIPYGRQSINASDVEAVVASLRSERLTTGPLVDEFEEKLNIAVGAPTVSVTSGTAALHCAYAAIGIQPGDEIITPPITFIATQATAALLGAKIVFADVQPDTANIDPTAVEKAITPRTKAIVAVDYAGHPADMLELRALADKKGIFLVEDAAHSLGSMYRGYKVGSIADVTTFSFFPTKNITTGEGGAVSSPDPKILERARRFARQGLVRDSDLFELENDGPWHQEVQQFGLNYRLPDLLCALGISQLARIQEFKSNKQRIFQHYYELLGDIDWISLPRKREYVDVNWHLFPIQVAPSIRKSLFSHLRGSGIGVQVNYIPAYRHPAFRNVKVNRRDYPVSEKFYESEISLPMFPDLSSAEVEQVANAVKTFRP